MGPATAVSRRAGSSATRNQFRAAVAINAVTDLNMMWALSDLKSWVEWEFGGRPWEVSEKTASPQSADLRRQCAHADAGTALARRPPLSTCRMGRAFHEALKANGATTEMIVYPDEGHGIRQPRHREDVLSAPWRGSRSMTANESRRRRTHTAQPPESLTVAGASPLRDPRAN